MNKAKLIIAASENSADMLYVSGLFVPDPFIAIELDGRWHGLLSPLEVDRARKTSCFDEVHLDSPWREQAGQPGLAHIAAAFLQSHRVSTLEVPGHFPLIYADQLKSYGFTVAPAGGSLFPQRAVKNEHEIKQLAKAEKLTRRAMQQAERFLADCGIGNDGILTHPETEKRVKSADVRRVIESFLIGQGAMPAHTIVACGREGADPHNIGHGHIRAGQPIIIDIFPRLLSSGYWGDMTRSFVKGKASKELQKMYDAVRDAQDIGLNMIAAGVNSRDIHQAILDHFDQSGFKTGMVRGKQTGFFHGTGHGVGLEIHEGPRISLCDDVLQAQNVVTVEPGLYYPRIGGIRIEDMVVVREGGHENLTKYARRLEIP